MSQQKPTQNYKAILLQFLFIIIKVSELELEKGMASHSSILDWIIPRTEEPGGLQSMESQRVGHN